MLMHLPALWLPGQSKRRKEHSNKALQRERAEIFMQGGDSPLLLMRNMSIHISLSAPAEGERASEWSPFMRRGIAALIIREEGGLGCNRPALRGAPQPKSLALCFIKGLISKEGGGSGRYERGMRERVKVGLSPLRLQLSIITSPSNFAYATFMSEPLEQCTRFTN